MSGRLPDMWLEDLRSRNNIEEIVSEYVPLKQKGKRYWGCCPFHNEKTPSFSVNTETQFYYCFGCHKTGTVINFVMEMERMEFMEAVRYLADRAHMEVPDVNPGKQEKRLSKDDRERMYEANRAAARYFHALLWKPEGADALNYLYGRGLNDSDIRHFGLGASPKGWDTLLRQLNSDDFETPLLDAAGLVLHGEKGNGDMFRNRVMFPIIDAQGHVLGFGGRAMSDIKPKYMNTSDTPIFSKRLGLYALNFVKQERGLKRLVLVEGYMDTVSLRKNGVQGVVATLGTALTPEQAHLMRRYASEVWISYDGDAAGQKAALRALDIFDAEGLPAKVIDYPAGMDPDDYVKANGLVGFEALPKYDATEYRMIRAKDNRDLSIQADLTQYTIDCCAIIRNLKDPVIAENYIRRLVNETGYDRETLLRQIGTIAPESPIKTPLRRKADNASESETLPAERALITLLSTNMIRPDMVRVEDFSTEIHRSMVQWITEGKPTNALFESLSDDKEREAAGQALNYTPIPESREDAFQLAEDCIKTIRTYRLNARMTEIRESIATATGSQKAELYRQMAAITKELNGLPIGRSGAN